MTIYTKRKNSIETNIIIGHLLPGKVIHEYRTHYSYVRLNTDHRVVYRIQ